MLTVDDHIEQTAQHGDSLAAYADAAGLDATVPSCPAWDVRELLAHVGRTHRWATAFVATGRTTPPEGDHELAVAPGDEELLDWFRAGHRDLVAALRAAPDDLACWSFLPAPSPRAFWARRQAHETAIHAVDAALAATVTLPFDTAFAIDGIDELLLGFFARRGRGRLVADPPVTVAVRATDAAADDAWTLRIGPDGRTAQRGEARGDCVLSGRAADLYLMLWNRRDLDGIDVTGDRDVLDLWRAKARVTWS